LQYNHHLFGNTIELVIILKPCNIEIWFMYIKCKHGLPQYMVESLIKIFFEAKMSIPSVLGVSPGEWMLILEKVAFSQLFILMWAFGLLVMVTLVTSRSLQNLNLRICINHIKILVSTYNNLKTKTCYVPTCNLWVYIYISRIKGICFIVKKKKRLDRIGKPLVFHNLCISTKRNHSPRLILHFHQLRDYLRLRLESNYLRYLLAIDP